MTGIVVGILAAAFIASASPALAADPVGETIFAANTSAGTVVAVRPDGTGLVTVACTGERSFNGSPRRIVRIEAAEGAEQIVSRDEACADPVVLWAPGPGYDLVWPTWSMDGRRVAVAGARVGPDGAMVEQGIWVIEVAACSGSCPVRLAVTFPMVADPGSPMGYVAYPAFPRFSSDHRRVVYDRVIDPARNPQLTGIFVADLGLPDATGSLGDRQVVVAGTHRGQYQPSFSPVAGSDLIVYSETTSTRGPQRNDLFVTTAAGGSARQVTPTKAANIVQIGRPCWSPDGRWIAFDGYATGLVGIYRIRADGSGKIFTVLAVSGIGYMAPAWRR